MASTTIPIKKDKMRHNHIVMKDNRRHNHIGSINTLGGVLSTVKDIKDEVVRNFSRKFREVGGDTPILDGISFNSISGEDKRWLERPFQEVEVKEAIVCCGGTKSPGPDGFTFHFIKKCWYFLRVNFMRFLEYLYTGGELSKAVTSSFLALISKSSNPLGLDDYRHICSVGCMYKVVAKKLAGKLKHVLNSIVSHCQSAFVPGRLLLDDVLVSNEVVDFARK